MAIAPERTGIGIRRYFTTPGTDPYETLTWERRDARITNWQTGAVAFEQPGVEVPASWSQNATNILAQKYFRGTLGTRERESSLRQVVDRVVGTIAAWGKKDGYFADKAEADAFEAELKWLIVHQRAAFNSPVWFNIGVPGVPQQASACFILSVEDSMDSILNWYVEEGKIFKGGSGAGINLSKIRSSKEGLRGGGTASGPVSFMRGADASAGTIKSGGKCFKEGTLVATPEGWRPIEQLRVGDLVLTHQGPRAVVDFMPNGKRQCYRVRTREGYEVEVTAGHKFAYWDAELGCFSVKPIEDFFPGDALYALVQASLGGARVPLLPPQVADRVNATTAVEMQFPTELDDRLAYVVGLTFGDAKLGPTYPFGFRVAFSKDEAGRASAERFSGYCHRLFGERPLLLADRPGHMAIGFNSRRLVDFLVVNGLAKGKGAWLGFPGSLFRAEPAVRAAFVAGVIDADGTYQRHGGWSIASMDRSFLVQLQRLLLSLGVASKLGLARRKRCSWRAVYRLRVVGEAFIDRLVQHIGPYSAKAQLSYVPCLGSDKGWAYGPAAFSELVPGVERAGGYRTGGRSLGASYETSGHGAVATLVRRPGQETTSYLAEPTSCAQLTLESVAPTVVAETYDIEVEDAHLLSANGIYASNTRRAAKMVLLNADHPDIEDFIWCKAIEERKARALRDAGFDMDLDGKDSYSVQYQNANNSVRVTDEFMQAVLDDRDWELRAVTTGEVLKTVKARDLFRQVAKAAWECADPGLQFDTTINRWHTAPNTGRINASNPCSEYLHLDNSACNLASLNLLAFLEPDGAFDVEGFKAAVEVVFTAQEILVGNADYPTKAIADTSRRFRELGLGYANLGALLMAQGLPYDSDAGRAWAGAITALMTGHAYTVSARTAARMGPFAGYHDNKEAMLEVLRMHRAEVAKINEELVPVELLSAAQEAWDTAVAMAEVYGVRNSQATVLAPTGTIGLLLDCDTTGIEPDLSLVKTKKLVGGGTMSIVNQTVPRALRRLGYSEAEVADITAYIDEHKSIVGAPQLRPEHLPVFACSMGDNTIHYRGHVKMMAAAQPFISGAISKCVTAETLVATGSGLVRVGSLYGGEGARSFRSEILEVASLEGTEKTDAFYYGGVQPVRTVTLRSGLKLTGTPNHRVLSAGRGGLSWRRLDELKEGEFVAARYGTEMWSVLPARLAEGLPQAEMTEGLAFFLGAYLAGGTLDATGATVSVACEDAFTQEAIEGAFRESFGREAPAEVALEGDKHLIKLRSGAAVRFLCQLGCSEGRRPSRVPDCVLRSPREMVLAFLEGLFQGAQVSGERLCKWAFNAKSAELADDLQAVLANLGVVTGRAGDGRSEACAEVYATQEFARRVVELVPFLDPGKQASALKLCGRHFPPEVSDLVPGISGPELLALAGRPLPGEPTPALGLGGQGANCVSRRLLERVAALPGAPLPEWLRAVLDLNLHFSPVESVVDAGEREVFDLSVPGSHSFVGNGIVNHNTVNMPEDVTVEDVEQLYIEAWQLGVKAIAIYRDNCKVAQPLATTKKAVTSGEPGPEARDEELARKVSELEEAIQNQTTVVVKKPVREHMPRKRRSQTFSFRVADCEGYVTVGEFPDGRPGEVFISVSKQGSTLAGVMDAFAISVSMGLQHGVPLSTFVRHFTNMRFEPAGMTDDPELRFATSLVDYIFRRLAVEYMSPRERADLGILTVSERMQPTLPGVEEAVTIDEPLRTDLVDDIDVAGPTPGVLAGPSSGPGLAPGRGQAAADAPYCYQCGVQMQRAGSCFACPSCGTTSGCS